MKKEKITIIIPCYNAERYIMRCFESIHRQTYGFDYLDVIFVDDLSDDNTFSIVDSLQKKYPANVTAVKLNKKGLSGGARNLGMNLCTGSYLTFLDADDYLHPEMLNILYDKITKDSSDIVQCMALAGSCDFPDFPSKQICPDETLSLDDADNRKNLIIQCTAEYNMCAWGKLFSTSFLKNNNIRLLENMYFEDNHFSLLCILLAHKYSIVGKQLIYYYNNISSITHTSLSSDKIFQLSLSMDILIQEISDRGLNEFVTSKYYHEIQVFLFWKKYIEPLELLKKIYNEKKQSFRQQFLLDYHDINISDNPYILGIKNDTIYELIDFLINGE